jgi:oligoendopeptidase F
MQSKDRGVREAAYTSMYTSFKNLINTIATNYNYNTKNDVVGARIRNYSSAREAELSSDNIPGSVYDNLVAQVNENLPVLHRYLDIRKRLLGVDELKMWDVYAPLIDVPERDIPYEAALDMIREALKPMGDDYLEKLNRGFAEGWIDVYENEGKTSGAYSFGSYDSKPYVLLNYTNTLNDVFTIIHEMGHSMHSYYTRKTQPFIYGSHSIFTAEVASTVNENLLMKHLIASETDPEMKKYLISKHIEDFRTTLFRQTMFAEFEDMTHKALESGETLTAGWLCEKYDELNSRYFGPALSHDDMIQYEWARIPHFYYNFYVYKYATGMSAALKLAENLRSGDPAKREAYFGFLKAGGSKDVLDIMRDAGVDLSTPAPVCDALDYFADVVKRLRRELGK